MQGLFETQERMDTSSSVKATETNAFTNLIRQAIDKITGVATLARRFIKTISSCCYFLAVVGGLAGALMATSFNSYFWLLPLVFAGFGVATFVVSQFLLSKLGFIDTALVFLTWDGKAMSQIGGSRYNMMLQRFERAFGSQRSRELAKLANNSIQKEGKLNIGYALQSYIYAMVEDLVLGQVQTVTILPSVALMVVAAIMVGYSYFVKSQFFHYSLLLLGFGSGAMSGIVALAGYKIYQYIRNKVHGLLTVANRLDSTKSSRINYQNEVASS